MTGVYQNDDEKKRRVLEITDFILKTMEYKRKIIIRKNKLAEKNKKKENND